MTDTEWVSVHLHFEYGLASSTADRLVTDLVGKILEIAEDSGTLDQAFFIRYGEAGPHIRLRMKPPSSTCAKQLRKLLVRVTQPGAVELRSRNGNDTAAGEVVPKVDLKFIPYIPEVARYGGEDAMLIAETFFARSSRFALAALRDMQPGAVEARRGRAALGIVALVREMIGDIAGAALFLDHYSRNYCRTLISSIDKREQTRGYFSAAYERQQELCGQITALWDALPERSVTLPPSLRAYQQDGGALRDSLEERFRSDRIRFGERVPATWTQCRNELLASQLHMTNNRLGVTVYDEAYLAYLIARALRDRAS